MSQPDFNSWQGIQDEVLRRIRTRVWKPGAQIPNEMDLAQEFGCARTTVNRALRQLADDGILERKRRSGTRVALHPVAKAVIDIPIIRTEIEERGGAYGYQLLSNEIETPPSKVNFALNTSKPEPMLHLLAVHLMDGTPYALEDRWINLGTVPLAQDVDFSVHSANEWLLENVPYTHAHLSIVAAPANAREQDYLGAPADAPLLQMDRVTWQNQDPVTFVTLIYPPGYRIRSQTSG